MTGGRTAVLNRGEQIAQVAAASSAQIALDRGQTAVATEYQVSPRERCAAESLFRRLDKAEIDRVSAILTKAFEGEVADTVGFSLDGSMPGAVLYVSRTKTKDYNFYLLHTDEKGRNFLVAAVAFRPCLVEQNRALEALTGNERRLNFSLPDQSGFSDLQRQLPKEMQVAQINRALRVIMGR